MSLASVRGLEPNRKQIAQAQRGQIGEIHRGRHPLGGDCLARQVFLVVDVAIARSSSLRATSLRRQGLESANPKRSAQV
ncbi:MAG: hypothetical protein ACREXS_16225 [Gammaproteobacteria bacterium]